MKSYLRRDYTKNTSFTTFTTSELKFSSDTCIRYCKGQPIKYTKDGIFEPLDYVQDDSNNKNVVLWCITYRKEQPKASDLLDLDDVLVLSAFIQYHGYKMIQMFRQIVPSGTGTKEGNLKLKQDVSAALIDHIRYICKFGWVEVSDKLMKTFQMALGIYSGQLDPGWRAKLIDPRRLEQFDEFNNLAYWMIDPEYIKLPDGCDPVQYALGYEWGTRICEKYDVSSTSLYLRYAFGIIEQ